MVKFYFMVALCFHLLTYYHHSTASHCKGNFNRNEIFQNVKNAANQIIERKGATYYAVALAVRRIVEAIVRDESSILTVSSIIDGQYGLYNVCLSLPSIMSRNGIERILDVPLSRSEKDLLVKSGNSLKEIINILNI